MFPSSPFVAPERISTYGLVASDCVVNMRFNKSNAGSNQGSAELMSLHLQFTGHDFSSRMR